MLTLYRRGQTFWARGSDAAGAYHRRSLGTVDEGIAHARIAEIERAARKRAVLGPDADPRNELSFAEAVALYGASGRTATWLLRLIAILGPLRCAEINGQAVKELARRLYPDASTDTWHRQVVVPVRAVINHAAELGRAHPIRIKTFTRNERMAQDRARLKPSRLAKTPGSTAWVEAFRAEALNPTHKKGQRRRRPNPYLAALAWFMFSTGARISQALGIRRTNQRAIDVDLGRARVFLPAAKGHEAQWIDITTRTVVDLANLPPRHGRAFGFTDRRHVYATWRRICEAAGIEPIMPHAAGRHGFFTEVLINQGEDIKSAMQAGRAASARLIIETYTHADGAKKRIRDSFESGADRTNPVQSENKEPAKRA